MPFSHHSHSGQFCSHAQDSLEDVVKAAISKKMEIFAMTEHMPREEPDLYPEEVCFPFCPLARLSLSAFFYPYSQGSKVSFVDNHLSNQNFT